MKIKPQGRIEEAQVIIAPAFGAGEMGDPGLANLFLGDIVGEISIKENLPIIAQIEVANALNALPVPLKLIEVIKEHRIKGKYLDTYEVLSQAKEIMEKKGWNIAILVAHPAHLPRCKKVLEKMGVKVIIPEGLEKIPFDSFSTQWWTRNKFAWWIREIPTRLLYKIKGWI